MGVEATGEVEAEEMIVLVARLGNREDKKGRRGRRDGPNNVSRVAEGANDEICMIRRFSSPPVYPSNHQPVPRKFSEEALFSFPGHDQGTGRPAPRSSSIPAKPPGGKGRMSYFQPEAQCSGCRSRSS